MQLHTIYYLYNLKVGIVNVIGYYHNQRGF